MSAALNGAVKVIKVCNCLFFLFFQPPIVVLNVFVVEADRLEAKDSNGYSDPYCMLGIRPGENTIPKSPRERSPNPGKHNSRGSLG